MDTYEYLAVLNSIIVGLAVAHVLQAVGRVISQPEKQRLFWIHSVWVLFVLANLIFFWWFQLGYRSIVEWTSPLYVFVILYATMLYLTAVVVVPYEVQADYREYFFARRRWIFGFIWGLSIIDQVDTWMKPDPDRDLAFGDVWVMTLGLNLLLAGVWIYAMRTKKVWFHGALAVLWTLYLMAGLLTSPERGL